MADEEVGADVVETTDDVAEAGDAQATPTDADAPGASASAPAEEQFVDPSTLPDEIKSHWKRMHSTYNQKLAEIRAKQADIDLVARYRSDPEAAKQFILSEYQRLGLSPQQARAAANDAVEAPPSGGQAPAHILEAVKAQLGPELAWMAPSIANAQWAANRLMTAPLEERQRQQEMGRMQSEYTTLAAQLSEKAPGWEARDKDMLSLLDFLQSGRMTDPRWGSKLEILHGITTNGETATMNAMKKMAEAAKNRQTTGQPVRGTVTNLSDRVRNSRNLREAMELASQAAIEQMKAAGHAIPE